MPSGRLAANEITAGVDTVLFTQPGGTSINAVLSICNKGDSDAKINIARCERDVTTPSDDDYLEYETIIRSKGVIIRDIRLAGYQSIIVYSNRSKVTFQVSE